MVLGEKGRRDDGAQKAVTTIRQDGGDRVHRRSSDNSFSQGTKEDGAAVVYSGDGNNTGTTSACGVENFTITNN